MCDGYSMYLFQYYNFIVNWMVNLFKCIITFNISLAEGCPSLTNGNLQCLKRTTISLPGDSCTFSCNAGYELQGSNNGTCLANQSWSEGDPICVALNCFTSPPLNNSQLQSSCDTQYQSTCTTVCVDGYTGVGGSYTCVVTDEDTNSVGWNGSTSCQRGMMELNEIIITLNYCMYMLCYYSTMCQSQRSREWSCNLSLYHKCLPEQMYLLL